MAIFSKIGAFLEFASPCWQYLFQGIILIVQFVKRRLALVGLYFLRIRVLRVVSQACLIALATSQVAHAQQAQPKALWGIHDAYLDSQFAPNPYPNYQQYSPVNDFTPWFPDPTRECNAAFRVWKAGGPSVGVCTYQTLDGGLGTSGDSGNSYACVLTTQIISNSDPQNQNCSPITENWTQISKGWYCPASSQVIPAGNGQPAHCGMVPKPRDCPNCDTTNKEGNQGNPINVLSGEKLQEETDYVGVGPFPLKLTRVYDSFGILPGSQMGLMYYTPPSTNPPTEQHWVPFTPSDASFNTIPNPAAGATFSSHVQVDDHKWRMNYDRSIAVASAYQLMATVFRPNNTTRSFTYVGNAWVPNVSEHSTQLSYTTDANGNPTGFKYVDEADEVELYDLTGTLQSISNRAGLVQTMHYSYNPTDLAMVASPSSAKLLLTSVTDSFGHVLSFQYDSNDKLIGAIDPNGGKYSYTYNSGNLVGVTYPDGQSKQYLYTDSNYVAALTGVIDENGSQFATWTYDTAGDALTSEHAGGVERVSVVYASATSSSVTDANGSVTTYQIQLLDNYLRPASATQSCGQNCSRTTSSTFDSNGNIASRTDYNGNLTTYGYDLTRDLETSRTEASGTPQARAITTLWHPQYRLPTQISEPGRTTTFTYDGNGNLLTKTISANGANQTWTYTYNTYGQILTATGPRTDVNDLTTYAYDTSGNLISITNALNQVTTYGNYDANGRVGLITDPNGATTALSYAPRGWLTSKVFTAAGIVQTTTYVYDNAGQLTKVTLPDNTTLSYTYDAAHRLTNLSDSLGNSINYILDLMSNRIGETVTDPNGVLTRQVKRVYDGLNRIQQVTGAAQ